MKKISVDKLISRFRFNYKKDQEKLGKKGAYELLDKGYDLVAKLEDVIQNKGFITFAHGRIKDCGYQVAAVVQAILKSNCDNVVFISVEHPSDQLHDAQEMMQAITTLSTGKDITNNPLRGLYGVGDRPLDISARTDHATYAFNFLLDMAVKRMGVKKPNVVTLAPFLVGSNPANFPWLKEVEEQLKNSVVISTADHYHYGYGYGDVKDVKKPTKEVIHNLTKIVEDGFDLLLQHRYKDYLQHSMKITRSDWRDGGPLLNYIFAPKKYEIIDTTSSDFSTEDIYGAVDPTWVLCALTVWQ